MKKLLTITALALGLAVTNAQTNIPATPVGFLNTALGYFTSHNPDLTNAFNGIGEAWTGADYQNEVNISSSVGLEYNLIRKPTYNLAIESVTRNAGIAGVIVSEQAGPKFKLIVGGDTEVGIFIEGGYGVSTEGDIKGLHDPFAAIGLDIKKALTQNTFAGLRFEQDFTFQKSGLGKSNPVISAIVGFKF